MKLVRDCLPCQRFLWFLCARAADQGDHAHLKCHQFMLCLKGSCKVNVDNGKSACVLLDDLTKAVRAADDLGDRI